MGIQTTTDIQIKIMLSNLKDHNHVIVQMNGPGDHIDKQSKLGSEDPSKDQLLRNSKFKVELGLLIGSLVREEKVTEDSHWGETSSKSVILYI